MTKEICNVCQGKGRVFNTIRLVMDPPGSCAYCDNGYAKTTPEPVYPTPNHTPDGYYRDEKGNLKPDILPRMRL